MNRKNRIMAGLAGLLVLMLGAGFALAGAADAPVAAAPETIDAKVAASAYPAITLEVGKPVTLNFTAEAADLNLCNNELVIPEFGVDLKLLTGDNPVTVTPEKTGEFEYTCWMGMIRSTISVVEHGAAQVGAVAADPAVAKPVSCPMMSGPGDVYVGSCCGG